MILVSAKLSILNGIANLTIVKEVAIHTRIRTKLTFIKNNNTVEILNYWSFDKHRILDLNDLNTESVNEFIINSLGDHILLLERANEEYRQDC